MLKYWRGGRLLDVGSLDSFIPPFAKMKYKDAKITATDVSEESVSSMSNKFDGVSYLVDDIYKTKLDVESFDYVCVGEVLEHLEGPWLALQNAFDLVKPGGWIVVSVPFNEAREPGAVDLERHLWSFEKDDFIFFFRGWGRVKFKVLRSQYFPRYKYCFPQLIIYCKKNEGGLYKL